MAYASIQDVRGLDGLGDANAFPDAVVQEGLDNAKAIIDGYTGTTWEVEPFAVTTEGRPGRRLVIPVLFIVSLTSVSIDGEEVDASGWVTLDHGEVIRTDGGTFHGHTVTVEGTAGVVTCPTCRVAAPCPPIRWAARTLAAQHVRDLTSRIPDRALQVQSDFGLIHLAQAGGQPDRPTSLPDVNTVLNRHRHRPPAVG